LDAQPVAHGQTGPRPGTPPQAAVVTGAPGATSQYPQFPYPPFPPYYPYPTGPLYSPPGPSHQHYGNAYNQGSHGANPSSEEDDIEDPTLFPQVRDWLERLNEGPLGVNGHNFAQYAENISGQGYIRILQLADTVTAADLLKHCPGLVKGTAKLMLKQACTDVAKICKQEKKERMEAKKQCYY
jgi:hypothetical protein